MSMIYCRHAWLLLQHDLIPIRFVIYGSFMIVGGCSGLYTHVHTPICSSRARNESFSNNNNNLRPNIYIYIKYVCVTLKCPTVCIYLCIYIYLSVYLSVCHQLVRVPLINWLYFSYIYNSSSSRSSSPKTSVCIIQCILLCIETALDTNIHAHTYYSILSCCLKFLFFWFVLTEQ